MADNSKIVFSGGAGAAIGVALGMLFGGPDVSGIEDQLETTGSDVAALSSQVSALTDRIAAMEAAVSAAPETPALTAADVEAVVAEATGGLEAALAARIDQLASDTAAGDQELRAAIANEGEEQVDAFVAAMDARYEERMRAFREQMEERREEYREHHGDRPGGWKPGNRPAAKPAMPADETSAGAEAEDSGGAPAMAAAPERRGPAVARTVSLADGKVTAYVAGFREDGEVLRVAINGFTVQEVRTGRSLDVAVGDKTCTVTYTGIADGEAQLDAVCE